MSLYDEAFYSNYVTLTHVSDSLTLLFKTTLNEGVRAVVVVVAGGALVCNNLSGVGGRGPLFAALLGLPRDCVNAPQTHCRTTARVQLCAALVATGWPESPGRQRSLVRCGLSIIAFLPRVRVSAECACVHKGGGGSWGGQGGCTVWRSVGFQPCSDAGGRAVRVFTVLGPLARTPKSTAPARTLDLVGNKVVLVGAEHGSVLLVLSFCDVAPVRAGASSECKFT
jgi:hypothetical protein